MYTGLFEVGGFNFFPLSISNYKNDETAFYGLKLISSFSTFFISSTFEYDRETLKAISCYQKKRLKTKS